MQSDLLVLCLDDLSRHKGTNLQKAQHMDNGHFSDLVSIRDYLVEQRRHAAQTASQNKDAKDMFERQLSLLAHVQGQIDLIDRVIEDESQGADTNQR